MSNMAIIQFVLALIILGLIYKRMISREISGPISKPQAAVPVVLGVVSVPVSFLLVLVLAMLLTALGYSKAEVPMVVSSVVGAFFGAGFSEEVTKLAMMAITIVIFRSRIRNVYEYILIGAGVGFGFTLLEEFLYGSEGAIAFLRLFDVAAHMVFGIIMAKHLGIARYNKVTGKGPVSGEYAKAFVIPVLMHTALDACSATNAFLASENDAMMLIGIVTGIGAVIAMFATQIVVLNRLKKNAEKYSGMVFDLSDH